MKYLLCLALLLTSCTSSSLFMVEEIAEAAIEEAVELQKNSGEK